jgi:hypothetical protein
MAGTGRELEKAGTDSMTNRAGLMFAALKERR